MASHFGQTSTHELFRRLPPSSLATLDASHASATGVAMNTSMNKGSAEQNTSKDEMAEDRRRRILTVCFGNLFRSPMAEALLRNRLPETHWEITSAGTHALGDDSPSPLAQLAVWEVERLDMSDLRSSPLTVQDVMASDYIFTMSRRQAAEVTALVPGAANRVRLLGSFAPLKGATVLTADPGGEVADPDEIGDPIGQDLETCTACCERIADASDKIAAWLESGADERTAPPTVASGLRIPTPD
jgi:protein-tyrosine phosphatase